MPRLRCLRAPRPRHLPDVVPLPSNLPNWAEGCGKEWRVRGRGDESGRRRRPPRRDCRGPIVTGPSLDPTPGPLTCAGVSPPGTSHFSLRSGPGQDRGWRDGIGVAVEPPYRVNARMKHRRVVLPMERRGPHVFRSGRPQVPLYEGQRPCLRLSPHQFPDRAVDVLTTFTLSSSPVSLPLDSFSLRYGDL